MRSDVKTLISALTIERNSLDRAIASLKQIFDITGETASTPPSTPARRSRRKDARPRVYLSATTKTEIAARMAAAEPGYLGDVARALSQQYGAPFNSIYGNWRLWLRNGSSPEPIPETEMVYS